MDFDAWWRIYPRREGKAAARDAWRKIVLTQADAEVVMRATRAYRRANVDTDRRYLLMPETWLREQRWEDDYGTPRLTTEERMTMKGPGVYYPGADL